MSFAANMSNVCTTKYYTEEDKILHEIVKLEPFKDLGVIFDSKLNFGEHIKEKINKAFSVLGVIKRNFIHNG